MLYAWHRKWEDNRCCGFHFPLNNLQILLYGIWIKASNTLHTTGISLYVFAISKLLHSLHIDNSPIYYENNRKETTTIDSCNCVKLYFLNVSMTMKARCGWTILFFNRLMVFAEENKRIRSFVKSDLSMIVSSCCKNYTVSSVQQQQRYCDVCTFTDFYSYMLLLDQFFRA